MAKIYDFNECKKGLEQSQKDKKCFYPASLFQELMDAIQSRSFSFEQAADFNKFLLEKFQMIFPEMSTNDKLTMAECAMGRQIRKISPESAVGLIARAKTEIDCPKQAFCIVRWLRALYNI